MKHTTTDASDREFVVTRIFDAPRELVWKAFTEPARVSRWWGPNGFTTTIEKMDFRPGGEWRHVMHGPDGTDYPNRSVFIEIVAPERVVYSHGGQKPGDKAVRFTSTWTFASLPGGRTRLTLRNVFPSVEERDRVVRDYGALEGAKQTLGRLADYLPVLGAGTAPAGNGPTVVVSRFFPFPPVAVFDAWLDPASMRRWLFATAQGKMVRVEAEPHPGGRFNVTELRGEARAEHAGTYEVIERPRRLVFTYTTDPKTPATRVTVEIAAVAGGCHVVLTHVLDPQWAAFADKARGGWNGILAGLENALHGTAEVVITKVLAAPRELVWQAWTDPGQLAPWWGPAGFTNPVCRLDPRPGGRIHIVMCAPDGIEHPMGGEYREVAAPERLVYTSGALGADGRPLFELLHTVHFVEHAGGTVLTVSSRALSATNAAGPYLAGFEAGMTQSLGRLADACLAARSKERIAAG